MSERSRHTEAQLRLFEQTIAAVPAGVVITRNSPELDYPIVYVNPAFERISGFTADEIMGQNCRFMQGGDSEQPEHLEISKAIQNGSSCRVVLRNYRKDGSMFFNELYLSPVRERDGKISHFVGIQNDITERVQSRKQLARQAQLDALTGIPNRRGFNETLERVIEKAAQADEGISVIYLDVDNLKYVNDSLGHNEGDELLKGVAERIVSVVRSSDKVARLGGDEFAIICESGPNCEPMASIMERLIQSIATPIMLAGREVVTTASVGIASYPADGQTPEDLLNNADVAMYAAKRESKNAWRKYSPALRHASQESLQIAFDLRAAITRSEFYLVYQPRFHSTTRRLAGMEALVRWKHPQHGIVPPDRFIGIAEETGLINEIGRWVLSEALSQAARWGSMGLKMVPVSVNVSPVQVRNPNFVQTVESAWRSSYLPPGSIEIEVTESLLLDLSACQDPLLKIRAMGIRLALDDFGTGFSALSYLQRFKMDTLKIDRSFIASIRDTTSAAICRVVLNLARELGMRSVAEGVETEAQASALERWGCDELQGFLLGMPLPSLEMENLLIRENKIP